MKYIIIISILLAFFSCNKEVALEEKEFQMLLLDMHKLDGILNVKRNSYQDKKKNGVYYDELFAKYGITKADFDSCMYYYSGNAEAFSKMYDVIVDSLNKELTDIDLILSDLKKNDTVNLYRYYDTLFIDSMKTITLDSLEGGFYKFSTSLKFDTTINNRLRRIESRFISSDNKDTLLVNTSIVAPDSNLRSYSWTQYIDSVYSRLEISYLPEVPFSERPRVYKKGKWVSPVKKDKPYKLESVGGRVIKSTLFRVYSSVSASERMQSELERKRKK